MDIMNMASNSVWKVLTYWYVKSYKHCAFCQPSDRGNQYYWL
jgi:hypothetical protein